VDTCANNEPWASDILMKRIVLCFVLATAACGTSPDERRAASAQQAATARPPDPANAANDAVPAAWKSKLTFVTVAAPISNGSKVSVPIPSGWKPRSESWAEGHFQPPDAQPANPDWDRSTDMYVTDNCDGMCEAKKAADWSTAADRTFAMVFDPALSPKTIKDEKIEGRRTVIASMHGNTTIMTAWWKDGGDRYYECAAVVPARHEDLIPAFEQACLAARVQ
jgi:hypothetical protein